MNFFELFEREEIRVLPELALTLASCLIPKDVPVTDAACEAPEIPPAKSASMVQWLGSQAGEDVCEEKQIQTALLAGGYLRDDVPLSYDLQATLHAECERAGVPYELGLGLIDAESGFDRNAVGTAGEYGYCQLNPKWFPSGLTDAGNIMAGIRYLGVCIQEADGDTEAGLTVYNAGRDTGSRAYARRVLRAAKRWQ